MAGEEDLTLCREDPCSTDPFLDVFGIGVLQEDSFGKIELGSDGLKLCLRRSWLRGGREQDYCEWIPAVTRFREDIYGCEGEGERGHARGRHVQQLVWGDIGRRFLALSHRLRR